MPLQIIRQDITKMRVDAIVNTTNEEMIGYSGVDLAVHTAAGPELDAECAALAPLGLGMAKITKGYNLDAKYVIHTSGPVWRGGLYGESAILRSCYLESLKLAAENECGSVAFPLISSGVYGYPKDRVLKFAIQVITEFLLQHEMTVYICIFDRTSYEFSKALFAEISEFIGEGYLDEDDDSFDFSSNDYFDSLEDDHNRLRYCADLIGCATEDNDQSDENDLCSSAVGPTEPAAVACEDSDGLEGKTLHEYMKSLDKSFAYKLFDLIDARGMNDVECYKKANVDKKTFSKIKCNPRTYKPSKQTAVAFAIALKLSFDETQELLASAGLALSPSYTFDKIICYFIRKKIYDIFEINEALFEFDQVLLGC